MDNKETNQEQDHLQLELPQEVAQGEYANFAIITHSSSDLQRLCNRLCQSAPWRA